MSRLLLSASLLAISVPAHAQVTPSEVHDHDEIIVTGTSVLRSADEIVGNVTAIDREEIVSDLESTLGDTLDAEPGVSTTFFGAGASRPVLRGLGAERVLVLTNGIGVIDVSAASPDHQVAADGIDAERIEILRGPAALAYGGQAIGGVVNVIDGLIAEELADTPTGSAYGAYNTVNDGLEGAARATGTLGPIALVGSVSARDFDNYEIPVGAESDIQLAAEGEEPEDEGGGELENSFVETFTVAGGASWVGENGFLGASIRHQTAEYGLPGGHEHGEEGQEHEGEERDEEEEEEENPFIDLEQTRVNVRGELRTDMMLAERIIASVVYADYEHTEFEAPGEPGTMYETEGWEGRLEATHRIGALEGSLGVQALGKDFGAFGEEAFVTPTDTDSFAVFAYERYDNDGLFSVDGGLRYEVVDYDNIVFGEADFDLVSASVGGHLHEGPFFAGVELSYTERAPNESELFSDGPHLATRQFEIGDPGLGKESGFNIEGSLRYEDGPIRAGINAFRTDFEDFITLLPNGEEEDGFPVFLYIQQDAELYGGEIYAEAVVDRFRLKAGVDLVEGELDDGSEVPLLPPVTFNLEGSADFGALGLGAALTVAGDQDDPGVGQLPTDGYTRLDLMASYGLVAFGADTGAEVFVQVRNVTDEEIRYASSTVKDFAPAPGRNFRIGARIDF